MGKSTQASSISGVFPNITADKPAYLPGSAGIEFLAKGDELVSFLAVNTDKELGIFL